MLTDTDLRPGHRTAVLASVAAVGAVAPADFARRTPCGDWSLLDLLAHMTVQHHGFAAAVRGGDGPPGLWQAERVREAVSADPVGAYTAAASEVLTAFAADDALDRSVALPEFGPEAVFPGAVALAMHFVDYAVHGWDVARALDRSFTLPDDVTAAALSVARLVPDDHTRTAPGAPFGPAIPDSDAGNGFDRLLAHLGRSPRWPQ